MRERHYERIDFEEYCAALPAWIHLLVNRKDDSTTLSPYDLMLLRKTRLGSAQPVPEPVPIPSGGMAPPPGMRWKQAGERPPSKQKIDPQLFEPPRKANPWQMPVN